MLLENKNRTSAGWTRPEADCREQQVIRCSGAGHTAAAKTEQPVRKRTPGNTRENARKHPERPPSTEKEDRQVCVTASAYAFAHHHRCPVTTVVSVAAVNRVGHPPPRHFATDGAVPLGIAADCPLGHGNQGWACLPVVCAVRATDRVAAARQAAANGLLLNALFAHGYRPYRRCLIS